MNPTYSELLRDPRWQKKRLCVMQRDNFTCRICNDTEKTLNVHHCFYERGRAPWEYPDISLLTLCEDCHESQRDMDQCAHEFVKMLRRLGVCASDFDAFKASLLPCVNHAGEPMGRQIDRAFLKLGKLAMARQETPST